MARHEGQKKVGILAWLNGFHPQVVQGRCVLTLAGASLEAGPMLNNLLFVIARPVKDNRPARTLCRVLGLMVLLALSARGETPVKVAPCDLVNHPQKYTRHWVEVRGTVSLHFEDFSLVSKECDDQMHRGIWLAYGGDQPTPTISTVNDTERKPGSVLKVEGILVPLVRDGQLELLRTRLAAQRRTAPDGTPCYDHCPFYRVTATFVGLFIGAPEQDHALSGYGHMGCCHLFTISRVKEVEAERTGIPAGGKFSCSKNTWEMDRGQAAELFDEEPCRDYASCLQMVEKEFTPVAAHWGDKFVAAKGTSSPAEWHSEDMLTSYVLEFHHSGEKRDESDLVGATATRNFCRTIEAPLPASTLVGCRVYSANFSKAGKKSEPDAGWQGKAEAISRAALEEAARRWNVSLLPGLSLSECEKPMVVDGEQFSWCHFTEPTSMQDFSVQVSRSRLLHQVRGWDSVPWKLKRGAGLACAAEGGRKAE